MLWILTGTQAGCKQFVGELPQERLGRVSFASNFLSARSPHSPPVAPASSSQAYVFLNKSQKAMTFINRPYFARSRLLSFLSSYSDPEEDAKTPGHVEIMPAPVGVDSNGRMKFNWEATKQRGGSWVKVTKRMEGRKCEPDLVILATGYKQEVSLQHERGVNKNARLTFLAPSCVQFDTWLGREYPRPWDATLRDVVKPGEEDVAFLGFVRPGVGESVCSNASSLPPLICRSSSSGAIPPIAEQQAMWWTLLLQKKMAPPISPPNYYLLSPPTARIKVRRVFRVFFFFFPPSIQPTPSLSLLLISTALITGPSPLPLSPSCPPSHVPRAFRSFVLRSTYMSTLAKDMGSSPSLLSLWWYHGWFIVLVYW